MDDSGYTKSIFSTRRASNSHSIKVSGILLYLCAEAKRAPLLTVSINFSKKEEEPKSHVYVLSFILFAERSTKLQSHSLVIYHFLGVLIWTPAQILPIAVS